MKLIQRNFIISNTIYLNDIIVTYAKHLKAKIKLYLVVAHKPMNKSKYNDVYIININRSSLVATAEDVKSFQSVSSSSQFCET